MIRFILGYCLLLCFSNVFAQSKTIKNLSMFSSQQIAEVTWRAAEKQSLDYPSTWEDGSAIYLNYSNIYDVKKESGSRVAVTQLIHRKVKILDNSAIEYFSEIIFPGESKEFGFKRERTSSGVRILKKSGKVENIQSENYIRNEDDNTKKLAVPNLELGDVLEYFIYAKDVYGAVILGSSPLIFDHFSIQGEYPILHYKYVVQSEKGYKTWMVSNDEKVKVRTDKSQKNMVAQYIEEEMLESAEGEMWNNPYQDLPTLKVQVNGMRTVGDVEGKPLTDNEVMGYTKNLFYISSFDKNIEKAYKKSLKKRGAESLSKSETLKDYYFFLRHLMKHREILSSAFNERDRNFSANYFYYAMIRKMEDLGIKYRYLAAMQRNDGGLDDIVNTAELNFLIRAEIDGGIYFSYLSPFTPYGHVPYVLENSEAFLVYSPAEYKEKGKHKLGERIVIPGSQYKDNAMSHQSTVHFDKDDFTTVSVKTDVTLTGHQYPGYIYPLVDWYEEIWNEIDKFETEELAQSNDAKGALKMQRKKVIENRKEYMADQHAAFAKNHYYQDIKEITNARTDLVEKDGKPTELKVHFDCEMDNLMKKVAQNYILKLGKLVGGQVNVTDEPRKYDVHMDYPRMFDYTIHINLPEGYSVDGLEDVNTMVDNAAGKFALSHTLNGQELTLKFTKVYRNNFQTKEEWSLMKDFLKPANLFESKEILLRKK